ncbi:helix-turn-helix domain-containing protein [Pengzhenrongella sp.]|uniref:TetR/AcrR family transcriptional regulator n=1 Tax=Pengzhenrongella sp. TaxID=2888820 RepID=UPI002F959EFB
MQPVKPRRRYASSRRDQQARETRAAVVAAAHALFLRDGFAKTTIASVAAEADVSVETVYKAFGGKAGLVRAICEVALEGEGPVPAEARSDALHAVEADGREIIRRWGILAAEVAPRVSPLLLLLRDAATTDRGMAELQAELDARRLGRMTDNARRLDAAGHLRADLTVEQAGELLWTFSSPELYELLVVRRAWDAARYGTFIADAVTAALLSPDGGAPASAAGN